jgi:hypothetical protein
MNFRRRLDRVFDLTEGDLTKGIMPSALTSPDAALSKSNAVADATGDPKQAADLDAKQGIEDKTAEAAQKDQTKAAAAGSPQGEVSQDTWAPLLQRFNGLQADAEKAQAKARQTNAQQDLEDAIHKGEMAQQAGEAYKKARWPKGAAEIP